MSIQFFAEEIPKREYQHNTEIRDEILEIDEQAAILRRAMTISWLGTVSTEAEIMGFLEFAGVPIPENVDAKSMLFQGLLTHARQQYREKPLDKQIVFIRRTIEGVVHYGYAINLFNEYNAVVEAGMSETTETNTNTYYEKLEIKKDNPETADEVTVEPATYIFQYFMQGKSRKQLSMSQLYGPSAPQSVSSLPKADVIDVLHRLRDDGMIELLRSKRTKNQYVIRISQQVLADMLEMMQDGTYDEFLSMYAVQGCDKNVA